MPEFERTASTGKVQAAAEQAINLLDELLVRVEMINYSAVDASRYIAEAVEDALPSQEDGSRRPIISPAVDLADRLVTMEHHFLRNVLKNLNNSAKTHRGF